MSCSAGDALLAASKTLGIKRGFLTVRICRYIYKLQIGPHGSFRPVFPDFLSDSVAAADTERSMTRLGSTSPRMTRWAHDAAARVARPVSRSPAVARRDAGNTAAQAIAVPIFWSRVARLSAVRHDAHCFE